MRTTVLMLTLAAALPVAAQQQQAKDDPTNKVAGGAVPAGWSIRLDEKDKTRFTANDTKFVVMGAGYHVTSGPAALYYNAANQPTGAFTAMATFGQRTAPMHPEGYGVFIGGSKIETPEQQYFYFLVRGDGKYFLAHRAGNDVHKIVDWTEDAAINKQNEAGATRNAVAMQVTADSVHMLANGKRVKSFAKSELHGFNTDGQVGVRVNHNLDVHIGTFEVKK
jgi:hypothetical protein